MNQHKSSNGLVWGTLLLGFGLFLLAKKLGWLHIDWEGVLRFWPLLLVAAGISLLANRSWSATLSALLIALAIPSAIVNGTHKTVKNIENKIESFDFDDNENDDNNSDEDVEEREQIYSSDEGADQQFSEKYSDGIKEATLNFSGGAGKFEMDGNTNNLFDAQVNAENNLLKSYSLSTKRNDMDKTTTLNFKMDGKKDSTKIEINDWEDINNNAKMQLNNQPEWTINAKMGAGKADFDLSDYRIKKVTIETGVSDVDLKLGDKIAFTEVEIKSGVASIDIDIPESVGCEFVSKGALNIKKFDHFEKINDGLYRTANFDKASKKIKIKYEGGLSRLKVNRY
jgi:Domain of unknown function (DUF5668)